MKDDEFKLEYEKLKPRYDVISQIIEARAREGLTQEDLAFRGDAKIQYQQAGKRNI